MEPSSRPRHQIRAQGRRKGHAGFVIVENEVSTLKWHPGAERGGAAVAVAERKKGKRGSLELLEFLSRTAVQSEKELLSTLDEPEAQSPSNSVTEFRRIISNVQKNDRTAFRQIRTDFTEAGASTVADLSGKSQVTSSESGFESGFDSGYDSSLKPSLDSGFSSNNEAAAMTDATAALADASSAYVQHVLEHQEEMTAADQSGSALRSLLKELNDWLNASNSPTDIRQTGNYAAEDLPVKQFYPAGRKSQPVAPLHAQTNSQLQNTSASTSAHSPFSPLGATRQSTSPSSSPAASAAVSAAAASLPATRSASAASIASAATIGAAVQSHFGFEQAKDWTQSSAQKVVLESGSLKETSHKLSPFFEAAKRQVVAVKNLPLGRRIETHENGAVVEKDELGRVTQIRARCGEIISVYYGRDGAPEGFVRTDAKGVLHSVAECDSQGVVLRDENGRVRAQGESLSIDPQGRISISRADGQYWSIDLARQMLSEKRRLCDPSGKWTALTAVFAADGFRMMTLFQKLSPNVGKQVRSHDDANRIWSSAAVETGNFRFYGRDGSTIEFNSEEALANLAPINVSSPAVRPIEPRWQAKQQAGTAWQSVHEYVVSYLAT